MQKQNLSKEEILSLKEQGIPVPEICKRLNVKYCVLYARCKEFGIDFKKPFLRFDKIDKDKFLELYKAGYNDSQISIELNVDHRRIQEYRVSIGLKSNMKKDLEFTNEQFQIFLGGMYGDSYLGIPNDSKNAFFTFTHSLKQKNYCLWKYEQLKNLCFSPWFLSEYDNRTGKTYEKVTIRSFQNKLFTQYEDMFYKKENDKRIKYINKNLISRIEPLGLAI